MYQRLTSINFTSNQLGIGTSGIESLQSKVASLYSLKTVEDTNEGLDEDLEDFLEDDIEMDALDPTLRDAYYP